MLVYDRRGFEKSWLAGSDSKNKIGLALLVEPTPAFYDQDSSEKDQAKKGLGSLLAYTGKYKGLIVQLFVQIDINGVFWHTPEHIFKGSDYQKAINLGATHGMLGILLFLFRCERIYGLTHSETKIVNDAVKWIIAKLDVENNALKYFYSNSPSGSGKLGWCYGDLAIGFPEYCSLAVVRF